MKIGDMVVLTSPFHQGTHHLASGAAGFVVQIGTSTVVVHFIGFSEAFVVPKHKLQVSKDG